jgi:uncharacterized repeat protein (TIGR01451 family)
MNIFLRFPVVFGIVACSLCGQSNETTIENSNPGTTSWQITNPALNREIEGYASLTSVNAGGSISFFVSTTAPAYNMDVFRLGWYGGAGSRQMVNTIARSGFQQITPAIDTFGRFECNWTTPYVLAIPANWVSGVYLVKLTASTGSQSYIQFVVREDARHSALLFQHSATTDNAYNNWPGPAAKGKSLYTFNSDGGVAAVKVSFNRPYYIDTDTHNFTQVGAGYLLRWEINMLRWLEKSGYDVTYCTNVDVHENSSLLLIHKGFLSIGHDEYWSWEMRANVEAARDSGVNLAFFSPNVCYWQIRMETSPVSGALDRTMVSYKETAQAGLYGSTKTNDPTTDLCRITTNWRFNSCKFSEQNLLGIEFIEGSVGCPSSGTCTDMVISDATNWALAGTGLTNGSHIAGLLGYEVDGILDSHSPAGTQVIAKSPIPILSADAQTHPFSEVVTYVAGSGATVFSVGTMQWSWGLDDWGAPSQRPSLLSPAIQTITNNVLARFGAALTSGAPDLTITMSHTGNFTPGQNGAAYTITASNSGSTATTGTVTVTDTIPTGLTAAAMVGTGWTCAQPAGPCTRSDVLAGAASYPPITLTVNVASNAPATVTNTATIAGGGDGNVANNTASDPATIGAAAGPPTTDNFNAPSLNTSLWTFVNPVGDGSVSMTGTQLKLNVPAGSNHDATSGGNDNAARVVQSIANADFTVTVKFDSIPAQQYQFEGLVVDQDAANYLRFQIGSNGSVLVISGDKVLSHTETGLFSKVISPPAGTTSLWLRVQKAGTTWTATWSPDGATFNAGGSFTQSLTIADIGPFAGNYNPTTSASPAFPVLVDSFVSGAVAAVPDLTITKSHTGNFTQGQAGATYTITVTNSGAAATNGTVSMTDSLPAGLTATAIAGTGWTCPQPAGPCTRTDALAAAASYPPITLTVTVANTAPSNVTNTAAIAGGGETNTANDTASDVTTIGGTAGAPVTDNFNTLSLNTSLWNFLNPVGDGTYSMTGTQLKLNVPAGSNHDGAFGGTDSAARVVQSIANADFTVTVKFDSIPSQQYQFEGLVVDQDAANYLRFQFGSTGSVLVVSGDKIVASTPTGLFSNVISLPAGTTSLWLRVQKAGTTWTATWSSDGATFNSGGSFTQSLTVADIGPFAGNYNPTTSASPAFSVLVDSFVSGAVAAVPDLTITKSHTGNFTQGQIGATYTITVTNSGAAATNGTVSMTDTLPAGLTATAISGTGWTCPQPAGPCTRTDALAAAASYPPITLTVTVANTAPSSVTNTAVIAGGGETNTANDTASDVTTIGGTAGAPVTDDFNTLSLNTGLWTFLNPVGDGTYSMTGTQLKLNAPAGANHDAALGGVDSAPRVVQSIANADFIATVKFDSIPTQQYQFEGVVVDQNAANYLRFQFGSTGSVLVVAGDKILANTPTGLFSNVISLPAGTTSLWLRIQKAGTTWTATWSPDGTTFNAGGSFTQSLTVADIGLFAGNYNPTTSASPAFSALVDSFVSGAVAAVPDLTIISSHIGNFTQGQTGATYTITVTNSGGAASNGAVSLTDTLPAGLTATAITGTAWTCQLPAGPCTRTDSLAAGASYPPVTLTVNVASNASSSVTNTAGIAGGGETNSANDTASDPTTIQGTAGSLVSDDFTSGTLNTAVWTFVNPQSDGSFTMNGNSIVLSVPAGANHDVWTDGENGIRVMQPAADVDFEAEVKFSSSLNKNAPFQQQGILVEQDSTNFLRLCQYSDNQRILLFLASISGSTASIVVSEEMRGGGATWMRIKRTGNNWLFSYSYDALHWTPFAFTKALHVTKVGPYAGNSKFNGNGAPAFTAIVDHFVNRAAPLSTIDQAAYPPAAAAPVINVWYGDNQTFGQKGIPQQWVNILGDVLDFDQVTTLTDSLNGGPEQPLTMGENLVRLVAPGNFNVEIDYASLSPNGNVVRITATDTLGRQSAHSVNVIYSAGQTWPNNYSINWNTAGTIQSVSQVVDGKWLIQSGAVNVAETGYDRLIALGDRTTWTNFVATAEVTMNSLDSFGFAVAIIAGWQGHTTLQYGVPLTDQPRTGHPFPAFGGYAFGLPGPAALMIYENTPSVPESVIAQNTTKTLQIGLKYIFKFQAQQQHTGGGSHYSFKAWLASATEPAAWDVEGDGELSTGSLVLAAHRADVSFGAVTVTGLSGL